MIVVTGAAGFIGSNIAAGLEAHGEGPIVAVDRFGSDERWRNLAKRSIAAFIAPEALREWLATHGKGVRAVVNMGAISATTERDVDLLVACNVNFAVMLWDWCAAAGVPFVHASSAAVYGACERGFADDARPAAISALAPLNAYGWSKKAAEQIFAARVAAGGPAPPQWAALRFFNVYGPNEYHKGEMRSVACKLFEQLAGGGPARLFRSHRADVADGGQLRDFVHVDDCVAAVRWLLGHGAASGVFNLGSGRARSFLDVAGAVAQAMGRPLDVAYFDMPDAVRNQYQYRTEADMTKLRAAGFDVPATPLEAGIADYVIRYLAQEDRYR